MRVWEISKGTCIRVVYGVSSQLCICFHPVSPAFAECILIPFACWHQSYLNFAFIKIICVVTRMDGLLYHMFTGFSFFFFFFLQVNNNLLLVGNANREINVRFLTFCSQQFIYSNILPAD